MHVIFFLANIHNNKKKIIKKEKPVSIDYN